MRVFLVANILFSAAKTNGAIRQMLSLLARQGHRCCADDYVVEEARRNLVVKAPDKLADLERILGTIEVAALRPAQFPANAALPLPDKDLPVLAAAIHLGCEALVTGDRTHFGSLYGKSIRGVTIFSPRSLAERLLG